MIQHYVPVSGLKDAWRAQSNPLAHVTSGQARNASRPTAAIIHNKAQFHTQFITACQDLDIGFEVIDILRPDWLESVEKLAPDLVLFWPEAVQTPRLDEMKDRLMILERDLNYQVIPSGNDVWPYEDKIRMWHWLKLYKMPHPKTTVFFDRDQALNHAQTCPLPVVQKTCFGASASGVSIHRHRSKLIKGIKTAFGRGLVPAGGDYRDREWGFVILQDHVAIRREWRMVRIGTSYFGHPKGKIGEFHSGSGVVEWRVPPQKLLELLHNVTQTGGFRSMNVDVFETESGEFLINELQTVFGASFSVDQLRVDGEPGRFVHDAAGNWVFEAGDFAKNMCANERVRDALEQMK
jgi:hypothetical protein